MIKKIKKAVFPVAGLGSRFLPATKAQPKEMLPIVDKPLIHYAVEEAVAAGITEMIFITGRNKFVIKSHFDEAYEFEAKLEETGKVQLLEIVRNIIPKNVTCIFIPQSAPLGLGHAILCAKHIIGSNAFAVFLADDFIDVNPGQKSVMAHMIQIYEQEGMSLLAVRKVLHNEIQQYGMVSVKEYRLGLMQVNQIIEKPKISHASSNLAIIGRYILNHRIFDYLENIQDGINGEIQLTDGIAMLMHTEPILVYPYEGKHYDCGSKLGYLKATVAMGCKHPEIGVEFTKYLKELNLF